MPRRPRAARPPIAITYEEALALRSKVSQEQGVPVGLMVQAGIDSDSERFALVWADKEGRRWAIPHMQLSKLLE